MPFYPTPGPGRRLRRHRLLRRRPAARAPSGDLVEFIRTAHDRGIRVIADLVVNHTSDQHPWFQSRPASPRTTRTATTTSGATTRRRTPRTRWCSRARRRASGPRTNATGEWYLHRFCQAPAGPERRQPRGARRDRQVDRILAASWAWTASGVDAVPFLLETVGDAEDDAALTDPHEYLQRPAQLPRPPPRATRSCWARSNLPYKEQLTVLRRRRRRRAEHAVRLHLACRTCTCRWPGRTPRPLAKDAQQPARRSIRTTSGRRSSATTTS